MDQFRGGGSTCILSSLVGQKYDCSFVIARVSNPKVIPESVLPAASLIQGDSSGCEIVFPSEWLEASEKGKRLHRPAPAAVAPPPGTIEAGLRTALQSMQFSKAASLKQAANHWGVHHRALQRALRAAGTSYSALIDEQRKLVATRELSGGDISVSELASLLGYTDLANFSRAFRRWMGCSPSDYRKRHRSIC